MTQPEAHTTAARPKQPFAILTDTLGLVALAATTAVACLLFVWQLAPEAVLIPLGLYSLAVFVLMPLLAHACKWPPYNWPAAMLSAAGLLLIASLMFQSARDLQTPAYADTRHFDPIGQPLHLEVRVPKELRRGPEAATAQPLQVVFVGLTPTAPAPTATPAASASPIQTQPGTSGFSSAPPTPQPLSYTLQFDHDGSVEFANAAGTIVPPQLALTWPGDTYKAALTRLSAAADPAAITTTLTAQLLLASGEALPIGTLVVAIEPTWHTAARLFAGRLLGDISLLVGLALAITGWGLELGKRQQERLDKEREVSEAQRQAGEAQRQEEERERQRRQLAELRDTLTRDPISAMLQYHQLAQQNVQWQQTLEDEFRQIGEGIEARKTRALKESLIRRAGEAFADGNLDWGADHLLALGDLIAPSISQDTLATMLRLVKASPGTRLSEDWSVQIVDATFALFDEYNEDARELCVFLVGLILNSNILPGGQGTSAESASSIIARRSREDGSFRRGWRFLRDPRLAEHSAFPDILKDLLRNYAYEKWTTTSLVSIHTNTVVSGPDSATAETLQQILALDWSRLDPDRLATEELEGIIDLPSVYTSISAIPDHGPMLLLGETRPIRIAVARKVCAKGGAIFPITLTLQTPFVRHPQALHTHLQAICAGAGEAWLQLLRSSDGASTFLDLPLAAQLLVIRLIITVAGSPTACEVRLGIAGRGEITADKRMLRRRLREGESSRLVTDPNELISCLEIRPPGLSTTWVIIDLPGESDVRHEQAAQILALAPLLHRRQVFLQLLADTFPVTTPAAGYQIVHLEWRERQLEDMLNKLVQFAGRRVGPENYSELTGQNSHVSLPPLQQLIGDAKGSFTRLTELVRLELNGAARSNLVDRKAGEPPGA